jgi:hypothetical protein
MSEENTAIEPDYLAMSDDEIMNMVEPDMPVEEVASSDISEATLENEKSEIDPFSQNEEIISDDSEEILEDNLEDDENYIDPDIEDVEEIEEADPINVEENLAAEDSEDTLKPHLKIVRMLDKHGLLDEAKLSFLIDVDKKDPAAIKKLINDSGLDPLDIDTDETEEYTSKTYNVSDKEVELELVLSEIRSTPTYEQTLNVVNNKWDVASRKVLLSQPNSLKILNEQIAVGAFDKIQDKVDQERMLGRLTNLSDLEAYKQVGQDMYASSTSNTPNPSNVSETSLANADVGLTKDKQQKERQRASRKKAASSPTTTKGTKKGLPNDFNPLALSDEEFAKFDAQGLI